jgi:hypothetical protein
MSSRSLFVLIIFAAKAFGVAHEEDTTDNLHEHSDAMFEVTESFAALDNKVLLWLHIICMVTAFVGLFPVGK